MKRFIAIVTALSFFALSSVGCYNTYTVDKSEFAKLQRLPEGKTTVAIKDSKSKGVVVAETTGIYARSNGGRRYPVTAFNFKMTSSQLVASDRDTLLALDEIKSFEVDHLSTWKTVGMITLGATAAAGVIVSILVTAGTKSYQ